MIENATSVASIQSMLRTMAAHQAQAAGDIGGMGGPMGAAGLGGAVGLGGVSGPGGAGQAAGAGAAQAPGFMDAVKRALEEVNEAQGKAKGLRDAFERGESVPLTDVVIQMQKSSLAFEATLQVRNKVMKAYEDILNMPV